MIVLKGTPENILKFKELINCPDGEVDEMSIFDEDDEVMPHVKTALSECHVRLIVRSESDDGWTAGTDAFND